MPLECEISPSFSGANMNQYLQVGQYMLVKALSPISVMPGWPLQSVCKYFDLNIAGMNNLPVHMMQECSMARHLSAARMVYRSCVHSCSVQANLPTSLE